MNKKLILAGLFTIVFTVGAFATLIGLIRFGKWAIG